MYFWIILGCCLIQIDCTIPPKKLNALVILADDGGFEMGVYRNKICQTPNLDKLARQSLIFNKAFTSVSSCSPSRAALLTGTPSHQNGMYGLHQGVHNFNSLSNVNSISNILKQNGIRTGIIGKKHVGPEEVYPFDFSETEENNSILQVGRNITHIKLLARQFLNTSDPFFLYIGFHDPHRCGHTNPEYGEFCQKFGNGEPGMGVIPDWQPIIYQPEQLQLPYFIPNTLEARIDVAHQYTTISRLDQGVGLIIDELKKSGHYDNTLIIYSSDNGIPFPNGRTNLYDSGVAEPLLISSPLHKERRNHVTNSLASLLDVVPTLLDWYGIKDQNHNDIEENTVGTKFDYLTGKTLLPLLVEEPADKSKEIIFGSHNLHEITMFYPMRMARTQRYKLIHNLNYYAPFPIDQDLYLSPTFQDILNNTKSHKNPMWYKTLQEYYKRPEWELYDLKYDSAEVNNIVKKNSSQSIFQDLKKRLNLWQQQTKDPWICSPHAVLEDVGSFRNNPQCLDLDNVW
ncbi:N-sulphoglucosamine sulphohydrolase [Diabrotica virgifera virgifera]|uniref:N-sulphoglucosamine sulphohydrolase n=1 Tax=Diabrotica virgifera virgifera TaxID=50390 RepID=A0ABM5JXX3_DIAVI|nr:N-sulphoglucosamine sulphohydrolase [Diabrotica virgifera virgifera]